MPTQPTPSVNYFDPDEPVVAEDDGHTFSVDDAPEPPVEIDTKTRRSRGDLEGQVKAICDDLVTGVLTIDGPHTPYRITGAIADKFSIKPPSVGAVTAVLKRWTEYGLITTSAGPYQFDAYTEEAVTVGLSALRERHRAIKKADRRAAKAAAQQEAADAVVSMVQGAEAEAEAADRTDTGEAPF